MSIFDIFHFVASNLWLYGGTFILVLSTLVFVHEWGHYIVARLCGVRVETFSIGFGKELFGLYDGHGTRWKFSLVPLGGYVKMFGDTDPASAGHKDKTEEDGESRPLTDAERQEAFFAKPVAQRAAIVFAGPAINFLFAIVIFSLLFTLHGQPVSPPVADAVIVGSAAEKAGFEPLDEVLEINGRRINKFDDIRRQVMVSLDEPINFTVQRGEKQITLRAIPEREVLKDHFGFEHSRGKLGLIGPGSGFSLSHITQVAGKSTPDDETTRKAILAHMDKKTTLLLGSGEDGIALTVHPLVIANEGLKDPESPSYNSFIASTRSGDELMKYGPIEGVSAALRETWEVTSSTLTALWQVISGTRSPKELGGIIRIGAVAGDVAQSGFIAILTFTALLSINLGLINLFPIPLLDGGHLVFYGVEAIKGSPIPEKGQEFAFRLGLTVLVGIMAFANLNDILQLIL